MCIQECGGNSMNCRGLFVFDLRRAPKCVCFRHNEVRCRVRFARLDGHRPGTNDYVQVWLFDSGRLR